MLPTSWLQVLVLVLAVVPGFVYQITRHSLRGPAPDEVDFGVRVLRSIVTSAIFAAIYVSLLGSRLVEVASEPEAAFARPRLASAATLFLVVILPTVAARVVFYLTTTQRWENARRTVIDKVRLRRPYDPTPTAWDDSFSKRSAGWVRVRTVDETWIGGWFGEKSFASSWPHPHELYIERSHVMLADGTISEQVSAEGGVYVRCDDVRLVEFLTGEETAGRADEDPPTSNDPQARTSLPQRVTLRRLAGKLGRRHKRRRSHGE